MGLKLFQVLTDTSVREILEETSEDLSPIYMDIPTLEGGKYIFQFELINKDDNVKYRDINISIDDSLDPLDPNIEVKLIIKSTAPTESDWAMLSNKNTVSIEELNPSEFVTLWIYVYYPGANELNILNSLQKVFNNSLVIESTEIYI